MTLDYVSLRAIEALAQFTATTPYRTPASKEKLASRTRVSSWLKDPSFYHK
jgi:hypothetical protein